MRGSLQSPGGSQDHWSMEPGSGIAGGGAGVP